MDRKFVKRLPPMPRVKGKGRYNLSVHDQNWDEIVLRGKVGLSSDELVDELIACLDREDDRAAKMDVPDGAVIPLYTFTVEAFCVA